MGYILQLSHSLIGWLEPGRGDPARHRKGHSYFVVVTPAHLLYNTNLPTVRTGDVESSLVTRIATESHNEKMLEKQITFALSLKGNTHL